MNLRIYDFANHSLINQYGKDLHHLLSLPTIFASDLSNFQKGYSKKQRTFKCLTTDIRFHYFHLSFMPSFRYHPIGTRVLRTRHVLLDFPNEGGF